MCTSWGELSWIKWNDGGDRELWLSAASTTSATPSPAASPSPRNLPFLTLPSVDITAALLQLDYTGTIYTVFQKAKTFFFILNNSIKNEPIVIIFGM